MTSDTRNFIGNCYDELSQRYKALKAERPLKRAANAYKRTCNKQGKTWPTILSPAHPTSHRSPQSSTRLGTPPTATNPPPSTDNNLKPFKKSSKSWSNSLPSTNGSSKRTPFWMNVLKPFKIYIRASLWKRKGPKWWLRGRCSIWRPNWRGSIRSILSWRRRLV